MFHKRVFLMSPLHHHFEKLGWSETDIVRMFYVFGMLLGMGAVIYGVWI
jgi:phospho-N-acetylmuramoyl-pentapeptide-transferase